MGRKVGVGRMTASEILRVALEQSAIDLSCRPQDLTAAENRIVRSSAHPDARRYLTLPFAQMRVLELFKFLNTQFMFVRQDTLPSSTVQSSICAARITDAEQLSLNLHE
jgi:hypothetical protein